MPFCLSPCQAESDLECWQLPPASAPLELFDQVQIGTAVTPPSCSHMTATLVGKQSQSELVQGAKLVDS